MKILLIGYAVLLLAACGCSTHKKVSGTASWQPDDTVLYREILQMDSVFFTAYNTCDMQMQEKIYSDGIEFYHDKGGLNTSKRQYWMPPGLIYVVRLRGN